MILRHLRRAAGPVLAAALTFGIAVPGAAGQEMAEDVAKDLWCGLAFSHVAADAPGDATEEQKALAARFAEGGKMLTDRARAALLESGYSDEALEAHIDGLSAEVIAAVDRASSAPAYSFEECAALISL